MNRLKLVQKLSYSGESQETFVQLNGPEFVAKELRQWLAKAETLYIERGSP